MVGVSRWGGSSTRLAVLDENDSTEVSLVSRAVIICEDKVLQKTGVAIPYFSLTEEGRASAERHQSPSTKIKPGKAQASLRHSRELSLA